MLSHLLFSSTYESALANQLTEIYKASGNADSYETLSEHMKTLQDYSDYKYELYDVPSFIIQKC